MIERVNAAFSRMLEEYARGVSNTSTAKYEALKSMIAQELGLTPTEVYATGATKRISNLDTRRSHAEQA